MKRNVIFDAMRNIDPEYIEAAAPRAKANISARLGIYGIAAAVAMLIIAAAAVFPHMMREQPNLPPITGSTEDQSTETDDTAEPPQTVTHYFSIDGHPLSPAEIEVIELHRTSDIVIIDTIESWEDYSVNHRKYYSGGYDGFYQELTDLLYRTKLDIEIVRAEGCGDHRYDEYYRALCVFFEDHKPKYLIPSTWVRLPGGEKSISYNWSQPLYSLLDIDEERAAADSALTEIWRQAALCRSLNLSDPSDDFTKYPLIEEKLILDAPVLKGQYFDAETCRTVLELEADEYSRIAYVIGERFWRDSPNLVILEPGEKISFAPDFSGSISVVYLDDIGLHGKKTVIRVESTVGQIPAQAVSFKSARLDKAIRQYLGKSATDTILKRELIGITKIGFYGDIVSVNGEGITAEQINAETRAQVNDFSYVDLENFPCLRNLTVYRNDIGNPMGNMIRYIPNISFYDCGITDISGLRDCYAEVLILGNNQIADATVLETANKLRHIDMSGNPLVKLSLPAKSFALIRLGGTRLTNLDFLAPVLDIGQLDIDNTEITDLSIIEGHRETER